MAGKKETWKRENVQGISEVIKNGTSSGLGVRVGESFLGRRKVGLRLL